MGNNSIYKESAKIREKIEKDQGKLKVEHFILFREFGYTIRDL